MFQHFGTHKAGLCMGPESDNMHSHLLYLNAWDGRYYVTCYLLRKQKRCGNLSTFSDILVTPESRSTQLLNAKRPKQKQCKNPSKHLGFWEPGDQKQTLNTQIVAK